MTRDARGGSGLVDWLYPNTPSLAIEPGGYQLRFTALDSNGASVDDNATVRVYQRMAPPQVSEALLSVDLLIADGALDGLQIDDVSDQLTSRVNQIYAQVHVAIADYTSNKVSLDGNDISLTSLAAVRTALAGARPGAIHIVLVSSVEDDGGAIAGYSLGLPGPVDSSRAAAGVLVATSAFQSPIDGSLDLDGLATTCAHEIGHYLGLYHTSERDGMEHDPIADRVWHWNTGLPGCK
jgi:hypothetical protein